LRSGRRQRFTPEPKLAPYFKRAIDAKDHDFDRERDEPVPASWLKSHGRSLVRYHLHDTMAPRGAPRLEHAHISANLSKTPQSFNLRNVQFFGDVLTPLLGLLDRYLPIGPIGHPKTQSRHRVVSPCRAKFA
jgi:hypothetical protein